MILCITKVNNQSCCGLLIKFKKKNNSSWVRIYLGIYLMRYIKLFYEKYSHRKLIYSYILRGNTTRATKIPLLVFSYKVFANNLKKKKHFEYNNFKK